MTDRFVPEWAAESVPMLNLSEENILAYAVKGPDRFKEKEEEADHHQPPAE